MDLNSQEGTALINLTRIAFILFLLQFAAPLIAASSRKSCDEKGGMWVYGSCYLKKGEESSDSPAQDYRKWDEKERAANSISSSFDSSLLDLLYMTRHGFSSIDLGAFSEKITLKGGGDDSDNEGSLEGGTLNIFAEYIYGFSRSMELGLSFEYLIKAQFGSQETDQKGVSDPYFLFNYYLTPVRPSQWVHSINLNLSPAIGKSSLENNKRGSNFVKIVYQAGQNRILNNTDFLVAPFVTYFGKESTEDLSDETSSYTTYGLSLGVAYLFAENFSLNSTLMYVAPHEFKNVFVGDATEGDLDVVNERDSSIGFELDLKFLLDSESVLCLSRAVNITSFKTGLSSGEKAEFDRTDETVKISWRKVI